MADQEGEGNRRENKLAGVRRKIKIFNFARTFSLRLSFSRVAGTFATVVARTGTFSRDGR